MKNMGYYNRRKQSTRVALERQIKRLPTSEYPRIMLINPARTGRWNEYIPCPDSTKPVEGYSVYHNSPQNAANDFAAKAGISIEEVRQVLADGYAQIDVHENSIRGWCNDADADSVRRMAWKMHTWSHCGCKRCLSTGTSRMTTEGKARQRDLDNNGCKACNGTGILSKWSTTNTGLLRWSFPASWTKSECTNFLQAKIDRAEAIRVGKANAKEARRVAKIADALATNDRMMIVETGCTLEEIKTACPNNSFIRDVCEKGMNGVVLSLKQLEALGKSYERQMGMNDANEEYKKTASEVPSGRHEVVGEVLSVKWKDSHYGGAYKAVVKTSDYKVYGTVPSALVKICGGDPSMLVGSTIKFTATLTPKEVGFGFYSRPTNAVEL